AYTVAFSTCACPARRPSYHNNQPTLSSANLVSVTVGAQTTNINAALATGGTITGTVTDNAATPVALTGICVTAIPSTGGTWVNAVTDSGGQYSIPGLAGGSYSVQFLSGCGSANYAGQFYNNQPSSSSADPVSVTAGAATPNIDAALAPGGTISGTVTDNAATPVALANVCVSAQPTTNGIAASAETDSSGHYNVTGLGAGSYEVEFTGCGTLNYVAQYYNKQPSSASRNALSESVA